MSRISRILALAVLLAGCAGRLPGPYVWTPAKPPDMPAQWFYGSNGLALGRVVQQPDGTWRAYGCGGWSTGGLSLADAETAVATTCVPENK